MAVGLNAGGSFSEWGESGSLLARGGTASNPLRTEILLETVAIEEPIDRRRTGEIAVHRKWRSRLRRRVCRSAHNRRRHAPCLSSQSTFSKTHLVDDSDDPITNISNIQPYNYAKLKCVSKNWVTEH